MENEIKTVHYLGSKARMLAPIKQYVDELNSTKGKVCDLFCGSAVVSEFLLQYYDVLAVDIQKYSKIYCEARLTEGTGNVAIEPIIECIKSSDVLRRNNEIFSELLRYEDDCMKNLEDGNIAPEYEIIEKGSLYSYLNNLQYSEEDMSDGLKATFDAVKKNMGGNIESLNSIIARYYGGLYFSFRQAIDIDAIASYAFAQDNSIRSKMIAALMGATTDVVNTVGKQFAQPLKVRKKDGSLKKNLVHKIYSDRSMDVFEQFKMWMEYYEARPHNIHKFEAICADYTDVLKKLKPGEVEVIYADPPYTRYHYSRYYHILETLCLHDNPQISTTFPNGKGGISRAVYRNDRHQSPFCIKSKAPEAFDLLFKYARKAEASLIVSYSPFDKDSGATPRLLSIDDIVRIAKQYYSIVNVVSPGEFMHSRFNSQDNNYEINYEAERLIICRK